jgi:hypothetical protein
MIASVVHWRMKQCMYPVPLQCSTTLCPQVTWSGGPRMALLTTSSGALEGGLQDIPPGPRNERNLTW